MKRLIFLSTLALAGCGTLPQPFYGNPGSAASKLAVPPAPVLYVPPPATALLRDDASVTYAHDLAGELAAYDVPSVAGSTKKPNWHLRVTAALDGETVVPSYEILGPDGKSYGKQTGKPVPAQGWANGDQATLSQAAAADAPGLSKFLSQINAQVQQSNPQSLENRTPRVFVGGLTGAPGDGNTSLPVDVAHALNGPDIEVVKDKQEADFTVSGKATATPSGPGQILVELDWTVHDTNNRVSGMVIQKHVLQQSDVTPYWGDVGAAAAQEAAGGILNVVQNEILKKSSKPQKTGN